MIRTVGVEEEFLLVRATSAHLVPGGDEAVAAIDSDGQFEHELKREQVELGTRPHESLADLGVELRQRRLELAEGATRLGARLAALATSPLDELSLTTPDERYERMVALFGRVGRRQLTCGMHVHVAVTSPDEGVGVLDRLRPWLAVLTALSASSPFLGGEDTGYASFRSVLWGQWPTAGVSELFGDVAGYEAVRRDVMSSGAAIDDGMIYFDARLSARYPTVELRVADVCPYANDAVAIAALARALVSTAAREWADGVPPVAARTELLRAASWRAGRFGVDGDLVDVATARAVPAWQLVEVMVAWVADALAETGDTELVTAGLAAIRDRGTGASLQRQALAGRGRWDDVVTAVVAATLS